MALTQVRAKLGSTWTVLTYNASTGRYEGTITPPGTSVHQPGGYYNITVEATNATGQVATLDGTQYKGLRMVVRETAAPTLTLMSPLQGWLTTKSPSFVFRAQDEAGGSGINPSSAKATVDGTVVPCTATASGGAYNITFSAASLSDGPHTVSVTISDYDGNQTTVSAAYTVDTVPPVLTVVAPDLHRVVDWTEVEVSGYARDATSGVVSVTVAGKPVVTDSSGHFSTVVHLEVGVNNIQVTAADQAGLSTTQTVWMLRLITDRTQADVDAVTALLQKPWAKFTQAEKAFWLGVVRGAYNNGDMNRVGMAVEYIAGLMAQSGYDPQVNPKTNWTETDAPTPEQRQTYVDNVAALKTLLPVSGPEVPEDMEEFTFGDANDLETVLVLTDRMFPLFERSAIYSGESFSGEF